MSSVDKSMQYNAAESSAIATNKVLTNTYALLSMTLLFSALTAGISAALNLPSFGLLITLGGYFGLLFLVHKTQNSAWGIASVFALTGFMGLTLGPLVSLYWAAAPSVVLQSLAMTGLVFGGLSAYTLISKRDFSFLGGFLFVGVLVGLLMGLAAVIFSLPALSLAVSAIFVLLMSGMILFQTSEIINGGERNYIMATVGLYVSIFNLFTSFMHLFGLMESE